MPSLLPSLRLPVSLVLLLAAQVRVHADQGLPTAVRKMGSDPGEKLFDEYLAFAASGGVTQVGTRARAAVPASGVLTAEEEELLAANSSASIPFRAPLAAHFFAGLGDRDARDAWDLYRRAKLIEVRLGKRDYACPTGTSDCSSIGYPDSCCQSGTTCVKITDTGLGSVGCCPDGESCSGSIACSGSQQGCPSESGGGCCIDGYACASVGCTKISVATATVTLSSSTTSSHTATTVTLTTATDTTAGASAPVRPTSGSAASTSSTAAAASSSGYCPTGFYACSAVYGGGCCQTGRDCQTTSCPSTASSTIISGGVTIVVPASDVPTTTTAGTCASGWSTCPSSAGATAGCCPSGYSCGTASCFLASASATASVAKELPGSPAASRPKLSRPAAMILALVCLVFGMALL